MRQGNLGHNYVGTEHILLGLLDESEGVAISVLKKLGVDIPKLKQTVLSMLADNQSKGISSAEGGAAPTPNLDKYGTDLTQLAEGENRSGYRQNKGD